MNAELREAVDYIRFAIRGVWEPQSDVRARWGLVEQALRDQEAVLQECETRIRELCACYGHPLPQATLDRITAHLGGEQ